MKSGLGKWLVVAAVVIALLFVGAQIEPVADILRSGFDLIVPPVPAG